VKFAVEVPVRWSDMDAYGHVNHARTVTLLEDARIELLFNEMDRRGIDRFSGGIVVSSLAVEYLMPVVYDGRPVRVEIWVSHVRAASFELRYALHGRPGDRLLATAETLMVPYDLAAGRLRRLTERERDYLLLWTVDGSARD